MTPVGTQKLLLGAREAAALLGICKTTFYDWDRAGRIPSPKRFGKTRKWSRTELLAWEEAGCPTREEWEARR